MRRYNYTHIPEEKIVLIEEKPSLSGCGVLPAGP